MRFISSIICFLIFGGSINNALYANWHAFKNETADTGRLSVTIRGVFEELENGSYNKAISSIAMQLTQRTDSFSFLYYYQGIAYYKLKEDGNARNSFHRALVLGHKDARLYAWLGDVLQRLWENDSAILYYDSALIYLGRDKYVLNNLGTAYIQNDQAQNSIKVFTELLNVDSTNVNYAYNLARAYYKFRDLEHAHQILGKFIELYPGDEGLYNLQGQVFAMQGKMSEARNSWEKSLRIKPDNNNAAENIKRLNARK